MAPALAGARVVLDVAPQPQVQRLLKELAGTYVGVDLLPGLPVTAYADLTSLPFGDGVFDVIVCYHVLEHVPDDARAMRELARTLAAGGTALIQVPRRQGATQEDPDAPPEERARRFGQEDHVRYYGTDFEDRLRSNGLEPFLFFPEDYVSSAELEVFGLAPREDVWVCRRRTLGPARNARSLPSPLPLPRQGPARVPPPDAARGLVDWRQLRRRLRATPAGPVLVRARAGYQRSKSVLNERSRRVSG